MCVRVCVRACVHACVVMYEHVLVHVHHKCKMLCTFTSMNITVVYSNYTSIY